MSDDRGALYPGVADTIRDRIAMGVYPPGLVLPSERELIREFGVARDTVRRAMAELRGEGLVVVRQGYRSHVADYSRRHEVVVPAGVQVDCRMPTPAERQRWDLAPGVPVFVVGGEVYPRDRYVLRTSDRE